MNQSNRPMLYHFRFPVSMMLIALLATTAYAQDYSTFKARNNVSIAYTVLLPEGYDADKAYRTAVVFAAADASRGDTDRMLRTYWATPAARAGWIVVAPLTPGNDWRTHPNHHALNDLMDHIREGFKVDGDFHIVGIGDDGGRIASTWGGMSREYFETLIVVDGQPLMGWDEDEAIRFLKRNDPQILLVRSPDAGAYDAFDAIVEKAGAAYGIMDGVAVDELRTGGVLEWSSKWLDGRR